MKESKNRPRSFDGQFKDQAVKLLLSSGRPLHRIATELGISDRSLKDWRDAHLRQNSGTAEQLLIENQRLRRELERAITQRDILKKSLGILSEEPPQKDMPK
jgi:transposase